MVRMQWNESIVAHDKSCQLLRGIGKPRNSLLDFPIIGVRVAERLGTNPPVSKDWKASATTSKTPSNAPHNTPNPNFLWGD